MPQENISQEKSISRKDFITYSWAGIIFTLGSAATYHPLTRTFSELFDRIALEDRIRYDIEFFKSFYNFDVEMGKLNPTDLKRNATGTELSLAEKSDALDWLKAEVIKYPPSFFIRRYVACQINIIDKVRLLKTLCLNGNSVGGFASNDAYGPCIYVCFGGSLINLYNVFGWRDRIENKRIFHHEMYHIAKARNIKRENDSVWANINPEGGNAYSRHKIMHAILENNSRPIGFAEKDGLENEEEDQATVASLMMSDPKRANELAKSDNVLAGKIKRCEEYYSWWSDHVINEGYWKDLEEGKVGTEYFGLYPEGLKCELR